MFNLKNTSIKQRLTLIIMAISSISVLITVLAISIIGVYNIRNNLIGELDVSASIVGDRNTAALVFEDNQRADENLNVFAVKQTIVQACLFNKDGAFFARYANKIFGEKIKCPNNVGQWKHIKNNHVEIMKPILKNEELVGYIYLESTLEEVEKYIEKQFAVAFTIVVAGLLISYLLAINLQRSISRPRSEEHTSELQSR